MLRGTQSLALVIQESGMQSIAKMRDMSRKMRLQEIKKRVNEIKENSFDF